MIELIAVLFGIISFAIVALFLAWLLQKDQASFEIDEAEKTRVANKYGAVWMPW